MSLGADQDGYVQVATDGSGKKVDNAQLTRDDGTIITRQRVVISSDDNPRQQVEVRGEAGHGALQTEDRVLGEILLVLTDIRDMLALTIGK